MTSFRVHSCCHYEWNMLRGWLFKDAKCCNLAFIRFSDLGLLGTMPGFTSIIRIDCKSTHFPECIGTFVCLRERED